MLENIIIQLYAGVHPCRVNINILKSDFRPFGKHNFVRIFIELELGHSGVRGQLNMASSGLSL